MRIDPVKKGTNDPYSHLTPMQKIARRMAIVAAFAGVFIWLIKIVF
jgi:hypothetical protein